MNRPFAKAVSFVLFLAIFPAIAGAETTPAAKAIRPPPIAIAASLGATAGAAVHPLVCAAAVYFPSLTDRCADAARADFRQAIDDLLRWIGDGRREYRDVLIDVSRRLESRGILPPILG